MSGFFFCCCNVTIFPHVINKFLFRRDRYFATMQLCNKQDNLFVFKFCPVVFASIGTSCLQQLLLWYCLVVIFLISLISSTLINWHYSVKKCNLPLPFTYWSSYSLLPLWIFDNYFILWIIIKYYNWFLIKLLQLWQWGTPLGWVFVLWHTSIFSQMLPYFLAPQDLPGSSCIFPGPTLESRDGNGNPRQYSCLENPMDGGVW